MIADHHRHTDRGGGGRRQGGRRAIRAVEETADVSAVLEDGGGGGGDEDSSAAEGRPSPVNRSAATFAGFNRNSSDEYYREYSYANNLLKIAHMLHYIGIGILGFFVIQVFLKLYGMGCEFFRKKLELFDAIIVLTSFSLDLVFVEGIITGEQNEEAIALLIIFLLWRILRIINGIMVTSKKRQDLLIQLQKRARRRAEKKIEYLEDDRIWKEREIHNLRELCTEHAVTEEEISRCKPRRRTILQKMDTSMGLSSIATLSLGLSMSMAGAGRAVIKTLATVPGSLDGRQGLQGLFPVLPLGVPLTAKGGAASRRSMSGLSSSFKATKWRSRVQSEKRAKYRDGDDVVGRGNSIDINLMKGERGGGEKGKGGSRKDPMGAMTTTANSTIDLSQIEEREERMMDGTATGERNLAKQRYGHVLIPDVIVHAAGALANERQYSVPDTTIPDSDLHSPPPPSPPTPPHPKREPDRSHTRANSVERRRRNRHLLGSRNPPVFSSSLPQLSLMRLAANNNNNNDIKNVYNFSLSSIGSQNNQTNQQPHEVLNAQNDHHHRAKQQQRFQPVRSEEGTDKGQTSRIGACDQVHLTSTTMTTPPATTCSSKADLALSISCGSPTCLSGSSSAHSELLVPQEEGQTHHMSSPSSEEQTRKYARSTYDDDDNGVKWSHLSGTEGDGGATTTTAATKSARSPFAGVWRCSKSQELQPKSWQENNISSAGFKTRHKSSHSMTKSSQDFF